LSAVRGAGLTAASRLAVVEGQPAVAPGPAAVWVLRATGLPYLPAIARRLHHGRDSGEPFDFLTWFEYAPGDADAFEELVGRLRSTEEWSYVEREVDIRLTRAAGKPFSPYVKPAHRSRSASACRAGSAAP
jgi:hypothetical protein